LEADALLADKAFDADARVLLPLEQAGIVAVIRRSAPASFSVTMIENSTKRAI
jgi:hypothetical protein